MNCNHRAPAESGFACTVRSLSWFLIAVTASGYEPAYAGGLLEYIRNYDLNDYALAVAVSAGQTPYSGGESSTIAYPALSSFRDSAFTRNWLITGEGNLGFRWVSENDWELGMVGRIQTLGLGTSRSPQLTGLDDREWGLELAPMIGYRGWPLHVNFKPYTEILSRHSGWVSQLAFSVPREWDRGYLVPGLEFIYQDEAYTSYYYGVSQAEANPLRPVYEPDAALNVAFRLRWGYAISDKWLLYGRLGLESLDSKISDSPIVDKDILFSATIAVAYDNDIFQPRISDRPLTEQPAFELRMGISSDYINSEVVRDSSAGLIGSDIDVENLLGLPERETLLRFDAVYRIAYYHRLEFGYLETSRSGQTTLPAQLDFGDEQFPAGTIVNSSFDTRMVRIGYAYSLINDPQKEIGVMGGLHFSEIKSQISGPSTGQVETSSAATPLPVVGAHGSVALGEKSALGARVQFFRMDFDRYKGYLNFATLDWQRRLGDKVSIGLAYNYYALTLDSRDNDVRGSLKVRHHGPEFFVAAAF